MVVCTEESVTLVHAKRLKERFDIREVKNMKCSANNLFLLVQRLDFTLHLVCPKSGQVYLVSKDVREFMWSKPADVFSTTGNPTFSVLQTNGNVELFEVKEKSLVNKKCLPGENIKESSVCHVGSITEATILTLLADKGQEIIVKRSRLVNSKQGVSDDEDHLDRVTLLFDGYLIVVLSFSVFHSSVVVKWFDAVKHVSVVPFLLPQQNITDIKMIGEMLFILYKHGVIIVYNLTHWTFHGWIDVFARAGRPSDLDYDVCVQEKRPSTYILDVDDDLSTVLVCDENNNVIKIDLAVYHRHFPSHLDSCSHPANHLKEKNSSSSGDDQGMVPNDPGVQNLLGDSFWRAEVFAISKEILRFDKSDPENNSFVRREGDQTSKTSERDDVLAETPWSVVILASSWMEDFSSVSLCCSSQSFLLWLIPKKANAGEQPKIQNGVLCCYSYRRKDYLISIFGEDTFIASCGDPSRPIYLLTSTMIGLPVFDTTQNELVNKIIMYENVAMAEKLCYLNNWDHFAVPISALEAALKHEQLDTVAFYLKTKGKAFTTIASESEVPSTVRILSPVSLGSFNSKPLYTKSGPGEDVLGQITTVVNLLLATIKASSNRKHSVQFTSQLLQMSFDYVNGLMQDAVSYVGRQLGNQPDRERIRHILSYLTEKTMELRWFLYGIPQLDDVATKEEPRNVSEENDLSCDFCSETQEIIFKKWSDMDDKDVIGDALLSCCIPLAQLFFLSKGNSYYAHAGGFRYVMKSGMTLVLEALSKREVETGTAMLRNMGEDVVHVIRNICLNTFDRPMRDYLIEELHRWDELREEEITAVRFLKSLESIYDNQSFESCQIRNLQDKDHRRFNDLGLLQKSIDPTSTNSKKGSFKTGSISPEHHVSMVGRLFGGYSEVLLEWLIGWDEESKERVLLEMLFYSEKAFQEDSMASERTCWQYLKAHWDISRVIDWISSTTEKSSKWPPRSSSKSCSDLTECSFFLKQIILDELSRNRLYSEELLTKFPLLLHHLCRTGKLFSDVHPLDSIAEQQCGTGSVLSTKLFHQEIIEYCSRYNFMNLLYYYLNFYRLCSTIQESDEFARKNGNQEVDMLLKFRLVARYPSDLSVICAMSFANSSVILNTPGPSIKSMLSMHRPIMAVATFLYSAVNLSQILNPNAEKANDIWQVDEALLKSTLSRFPRLCSALFPRTGNQVLCENPDVTLYELLQGSCSYEVSTLFSWQSTNILARAGGLPTEMPHFSQKGLVDKFAHRETLTYMYFLKHGRPSFAFATFLSKHQHRKYIPKTSISKAKNKVYHLAVMHFGNSKIVNSCVVFMELLGIDTMFVRIDVEAAKRILHHGNKESLQCTSSEEFKNVIVKNLLPWTKDKCYKPKSLLTVLENSTRNLISKEGLDRSSRQAGQFWSLPIMFCRSHDLNLTPAFLIDCAKADRWLTFFCHAQQAQFPKNQVLSVVQHYYETSNLKEHLHQALVNVVTVDIEAAESGKRKGKATPTRRDVRSQYLSRVIGSSGSPSSKTELAPESGEDTDSKISASKSAEPKHTWELGVKKEEKVDVCAEDEKEDESETKASNEMITSNVNDLNPETSPDNLFDVLSLCNDTSEPWRAILAHSIALKRPLFAVLAACYKDANLVDCLCVWFCSVHDEEIVRPALINISDVQWNRWTHDDLFSVIRIISKFGAQFAYCLAKAFYLFDPGSLLLPLMRFFEAFTVHMDFEAAGIQLSDFVMYHKSMLVNKDLQSQMIIGDIIWCEKVANSVIENMLRSCKTIHKQVHLFRLLCHCKFGNGFSTTIPDFKKLYQISKVLEDGSVFAQCMDLGSDGAETGRILKELLNQRKFAQARKYATLLGLRHDEISLQQVIQRKNSIRVSRLWENERERIVFWESCDRYLEEQECASAGYFFEDESKGSSTSTREKATLLCIAFNWFSGLRNGGRVTTKAPTDLAELERQMWLCIFNDRLKSRHEGISKTSNSLPCCRPESNLLQERFLEIEGNSTHVIIDEKMQMVLKDIIGELLDGGHITQARRLAVLFATSTTDLDIVLACLFLAQEIMSTDDLEENIKALSTHKETCTLSSSLKSTGSFMGRLSQSQKSVDDSLSDLDESEISAWSLVGDNNLAAMENLASSCRSGRICCSRIIIAYKICQTLGLGFDKVVCTDHIDLLCSLLGSSFDQRFQLATQYIKSFNLDSKMIAEFVAKSISTSLNVYSGSEVLEDKVLIFNPSSREDMNSVMNLAEDKLALGSVLFEEALVLGRRRKSVKPSSSALNMEVELLISAHHCQTLACNTDGISSILKMAKLCTRALADSHEYQLMVRLLTGIGRFAEMTYIFQTLMDHHHFEQLVKKGVDNENKLKIALLNYLDKYHMEDTEKHLLVAYRFNMHREVATSLKISADSQVGKLVKRGLGANSEVRNQLVSIAQSYTYAMDNFSEDGCLLQALECAKKHRLVELQKHLLPTGMVILDLNDKSLREFLAKYNNFFEAYIVADAYDKRSPETWVEPLFNHVILGGDFKYLDEITSVFQVSNTILSELVVRYRSDLQRNTSAMTNMKKVLRCEEDLLIRYKLTVELGYCDEIENIRQSEAGALLRDFQQ